MVGKLEVIHVEPISNHKISRLVERDSVTPSSTPDYGRMTGKPGSNPLENAQSVEVPLS